MSECDENTIEKLKEERRIFINAIEAAYDVLVLSGFYPTANITPDLKGVFSLYWCRFDGSLSMLAFWTDDNEGLYASFRNGETLHSEYLDAEGFFSLCYKD